jgi:replicative DNA helicase
MSDASVPPPVDENPLAVEQTLQWRVPFNLELEQQVIGILLLPGGAELYPEVAQTLSAKHFCDPSLGEIFTAIGEHIARGIPVSPITLKDRFDAKALIGLAAGVSTTGDLVEKAEYLREYADRRALLDTLETALLSAADVSKDAEPVQLLASTQKALMELQDSMAADSATHPVSATVDGVVGAIERQWREGVSPGVPTGISRLDAIMGHMQRQQMIVIAGRPAMGKSALALTIARHVAIQGRPVVFFSLEMGEDQMIQRLLALETGIATSDQQRAHLALEQHHIRKLAEAADYIRTLPLYLIDERKLRPSAMERMAREVQRRHDDLALTVIDYLQLARPDEEYRGNKVAEITSISNDVKGIAKALKCPVLALSQLSRAVEQRDDKRPTLADLRESGAIEQDADIVTFCYREEYYLERAEPIRREAENTEQYSERLMQWRQAIDKAHGKADVIVAKNRMGETGVAHMAFDGPSGRFADLYEGPGS